MPKISDNKPLTKDLARFSANLNESLDDLGIPDMRHGRQTQAAELLGWRQSTVHRWLTGKGWPKKTEWDNIAERLNVRMEWLFFGLGQKRKTDLVSGKTVRDAILDAIQHSGIEMDRNQQTRLTRAIYRKVKPLLHV